MGNDGCWGNGLDPGCDEAAVQAQIAEAMTRIGVAFTPYRPAQVRVVLPELWLALPVELLRTIVDLVAPRDLMSALWACNVRDIALAGYAPVLQVFFSCLKGV